MDFATEKITDNTFTDTGLALFFLEVIIDAYQA